MKNLIKLNAAARAAKAEAEARAAEAARAEEADRKAVEELAAAHKDVPTQLIRDLIEGAKKGIYKFIVLGYKHIVVDIVTTNKDVKQNILDRINLIYSCRANQEDPLLEEWNIINTMCRMQQMFQIAYEAIEAGFIPDDAVVDGNNVEHWIKDNTLYSTEGIEEANLNDLTSKLSKEDKRKLLLERLEKAQAEAAAAQEELDSWEDDEENEEDWEDEEEWEDEESY